MSKMISSRDPLRPSTSAIALKYHTVPLERLAAATLRDLTACGIPLLALGVISAARRVTLVGCVSLNDHARAYLPPELGDDADDVVVSEVTERLAAASSARSPGGIPRPRPVSSGLVTPRVPSSGPHGRLRPPPTGRPSPTPLSRLWRLPLLPRPPRRLPRMPINSSWKACLARLALDYPRFRYLFYYHPVHIPIWSLIPVVFDLSSLPLRRPQRASASPVKKSAACFGIPCEERVRSVLRHPL